MENNQDSLTPELNNENSDSSKLAKAGKNATQKGIEKGKDAAKNKLKDKLKKETAKKAASKAKLAAIPPIVIFWAVVVIVAIIILVGIIMFFSTMPGLVMDKLKELCKEAGNYIAAFFGADTTKQVDDDEMFNTLNYLEEMGYDVKGFGFLTDYYDNTDIEEIESHLTSQEKEAGYKIDEKVGVVRDTEDNIILAKSDFIYLYMVSDNYVYTLKNNNVATQGNWDSFWGVVKGIFTGIGTALYKIENFLLGPLNDVLGITNAVTDTWGKGLIALYYENGSAVNDGTLFNHDSIKIDIQNRKMIIKRGWLTKYTMEYDLDGWTGRYGMPMEFLLSVHVATMMPDLAYDMATAFNTNINIYLRDAKCSVDSFYKTDSGRYISYESVQEIGPIGTDEIQLQGEVDNESQDGSYESFQYGGTTETTTRTIPNVDQFAKYIELGFPHSSECTCHTGYKVNFSEDSYVVYSYVPEGQEYEEVVVPCDECIENISNIVSAMAEVSGEFDTYVPYIANVTNHWYRDVYYIVDTSKENHMTDFVTYDYDYQALMNERWTLYETYTNNETDDYAKKHAGEFKLFLISPNGEYITEANIDSIDEDYKNKINNSKNIRIEDSKYIYDGTSDDAKGEELLVSKKAQTINLDSNDEQTYEELTDLGWNINGSVWSAYEDTDVKHSYSKEQEYPDSEDKILSNIYTQVTVVSGNIKQTGEGQRTQTNYKIKRIFLNNTYFRYDGTERTAEVITALRNKIKEDETIKNTTGYGALNDMYQYSGNNPNKCVTELSYTEEELGFEDTEKEYKISDYSGQVTLNQDSLNAFSILENTHTLDADYIYRDFKELIVELGYFTKEELTDETPRLLEWLIPDIGSAGFPNRAIDKRENEYGTMIHSKGDIDAERKKLEKELLDYIRSDKDDEDAIEKKDKEDAKNNSLSNKTAKLSKVGAIRESSKNIEFDYSNGEKKPSEVSLDEFLERRI